MKIIKYTYMPLDEVIGRLRQVPLRGFDHPLIYKDAQIELVQGGFPRGLVPPQKYVLAPIVESILAVAESFERDWGVDVFALRGAVFFWKEGMDPEKDPAIPLLPPIVERSHEPDGRVVDLINDGMHRVWSAAKVGKKINYFLIKNVPREYPYYAYALKEGWWGIQEIQVLEPNFEKKIYRNPENYKALFRQFNVVFPGVQEQRSQTQPHLKP